MTPKSSSPIISTLLILGGVVFCWLGAMHAVYTFRDIRNPRLLVPADPSVAQAMANSALRLSGGRTNMWRAWVGFNFSHSIGVLLVGGLGVWAGCRLKMAPGILMPVLTLIGCIYLLLAVLYWFRAPAIGVAIGTACFAAAWVLSLT
jgi:hypothetical protein